MKTLTVTLKQHTPLIHFQHDQYGATLRVSEVKPKLDKFIIKKVFNDEWEKCKEYLVGYKKSQKEDATERRGEEAVLNRALEQKFEDSKKPFRALNYKINVEIPNEKREEYLIASFLNKKEDIPSLEKLGIKSISPTPYFAQESENKKIIRKYISWGDIKCKGIYWDGDINLSFYSQHDDLIQYIESHVQAFFLTTNLGTRQTKGFGSFSVINIDESEDKLADNEELIKEYFSIRYKKSVKSSSISNKNKQLNSIFNTIVQDWRLIKSGQIVPKRDDLYKKSKLMLFADKNNVGWDKKYIKGKINNVFKKDDTENYKLLTYHLKNSENDKKYSSYYFFRPLLGFTENYEFLLYNPPLENRNNKMLVSVKNGEVERYKSPILFKVIGETIYLLSNDVDSVIYDKEFKLNVTINEDKRYNKFEIKESLKTTTRDLFNLKDFIDYAMSDNVNLNYMSF